MNRVSCLFVVSSERNNVFTLVELGINKLFTKVIKYIENEIEEDLKNFSYLERKYITNSILDLGCHTPIFAVNKNIYCAISNLFTPENLNDIYVNCFTYSGKDINFIVFTQKNDFSFEFNVYYSKDYNINERISKIAVVSENEDIRIIKEKPDKFAQLFQTDINKLNEIFLMKNVSEIKAQLSALTGLPLNLTYDYVVKNHDDLADFNIWNFI